MIRLNLTQTQGLRIFCVKIIPPIMFKIDNPEILKYIEKSHFLLGYSIKKGEIYKLGNHRLMCGDSTKKEDVEKLMNGELVDTHYNDPPYNIGLDYASGIGTMRKYKGARFPDLQYKGVEINDRKKVAEYTKFIESTIKNGLAVSKKDAHFFYWCDESYVWLIQSLFKENGIYNRRICFWVKNNQNPTPQVAFNKVIETCCYGTLGKPYLNKNYKNLTEILNKEAETGNQLIDEILEIINLWIVKRDPAQDYEHPTQKPITLNEKPMKRCSKPGQIILDLFGGSGSTLISAEQLKRRCYMMEIDPIFCTVIIKRFEEFTGIKAKKV